MEVNDYSSKNNQKGDTKGKKDDLYHVIHKVPSGDTPYVRAKHAQVII